MLDQNRFNRTWRHFTGQQDASSLFLDLEKHYSEPSRSYHNAQHICDCLEQLDLASHLSSHAEEVELALWFHDAIYDSRAKDNEERSGNWARAALQQQGVSDEIVQRIVEMILATRHTNEPTTHDGKLIVDIDLSILGRAPDVFARYDSQIREEYSWVPAEQYQAGRSAILESFLNRTAIYSTDFFRERYEAQARHNLQEALAELSAGAGSSKQRNSDKFGVVADYLLQKNAELYRRLS